MERCTKSIWKLVKLLLKNPTCKVSDYILHTVKHWTCFKLSAYLKCVCAERAWKWWKARDRVCLHIHICQYNYICNAFFSTAKTVFQHVSIFSIQPLQHHGQRTIKLKCIKPFTDDYMCCAELLSNTSLHFNQHPILRCIAKSTSTCFLLTPE